MKSKKNTAEDSYWRHLSLREMSKKQWEDLCDGCGKCCLIKLEDEENMVTEFTNIACQLLDEKTCRCKNYSKRHQIVRDCIKLTPKKVEALSWLPNTCSYRLIHEGKDLPSWHHLKTGNYQSIHKADASVKNKIVSELDVNEDCWEDFIVDWIETTDASQD